MLVRFASGDIVGRGDFLQGVHSDRVEGRLVLHFKEGNADPDRGRPRLRALRRPPVPQGTRLANGDNERQMTGYSESSRREYPFDTFVAHRGSISGSLASLANTSRDARALICGARSFKTVTGSALVNWYWPAALPATDAVMMPKYRSPM